LATKDRLTTLPDELTALFISTEPEYCVATDFSFVDDEGVPFETDSDNYMTFNVAEGKIVVNEKYYMGGDLIVNVKA